MQVLYAGPSLQAALSIFFTGETESLQWHLCIFIKSTLQKRSGNLLQIVLA